MELRGQTALVTGASGFIGRNVVVRLLQEGMLVRGLLRPDPAKAEALAALGGQVVTGDVTDPASLLPAVEGCALVIHAAAWVSESGSRDEVWRVNVGGTENMVAASLAAGVERFIHISSAAVYGSPQHLNISEDEPRRKRGDLYGDSKVDAEAVVERAVRERGLPAVILRPSQVYGPGSPQFTIRPVEAIQSGTLVLVGGGIHFCKPLYIDNLVDGIVAAATVDAALGQAFNLSDGDPVPWHQFFGAYAKMLGHDPLPSVPYPAAWVFALIQEGRAALAGRRARVTRKALASLRSRNSFSNEKARRVLGWQPRVDFDEGMRRSEAWLAENGYLSRKQVQT